jgi:hypothetical protein
MRPGPAGDVRCATQAIAEAARVAMSGLQGRWVLHPHGTRVPTPDGMFQMLADWKGLLLGFE